MSRQLRAVLRATVNSTFGISAARWRYLGRRERLWEPLLMLFGIGTGVVLFGYGIYRIALAITSTGLAIGQPELGLGTAVVMSQVLVLFMGFFMVVSAFYFARDLTTLVPLPINPGTIITAKFLTLLIGEYITIAFIYIPAVAAYAHYVPLGPEKLLVAVLVFLLIPVLPLAISSIAALVLMRGISRRHRDVMFYAASLLFLAFVLTWQIGASRIPEGGDLQRYLEELITGRLGLVRMMASRFPPALWATIAVHEFPSWDGLRYLGYTVGSAIASMWALGLLGNRLFYRGLIGADEAGSTRRAPNASARRRSRSISEAAGALVAPPATPLRALYMREWALLSRTPIWMLNNVLPGLIMPLLMLLPIMMQSDIRSLLDQLAANPAAYTLAGLALAGFLAFVTSVSGVAPTSISREGGRFWISRIAPQPAHVQLQAKLALSMSVVAASAIPTIAAFGIILRLPLVHLIGGAVVGLAAGFSVTVFGLRVDLTRPMLRWQDPQEPVKRNLNALVPMGLTLAFVAAGAAGYAVMSRAGAPALLVYAVFALAFGAAGTVLYRSLVAGAEGLYARLDV